MYQTNMAAEINTSFEQDRDRYEDFRDMLADDSLSPEEVEDLHERYDAECEAVVGETMELRADLRQEVGQYEKITQISGDKMQVDSELEIEGEVATELSLAERTESLIEQSNIYGEGLIRQLQMALGNIGVDGDFGNQSATRVLEIYPELTDLEAVFAAEEINTDVDGILSSDGSPEVFRNLYGEYIDALGNDLGLPAGFIEAVIRKETTYGATLNSPTGSKGLMQLTMWPFKDMRGDVGDRIGVASERVLRYQELFRRIDLDGLLAIQIGEEGVAESRIPEDIVAHLRNIQDSDDVASIQDSVTALYDHIKGNRDEYDHETNMIIGSVYLAYQYERADGNLWRAARNYNGDRSIDPNGREARLNYADTVQGYFNALQ